MTVCIAGLFRWNYGTLQAPDHGMMGIAISDRMITAHDVAYEPQQLKLSSFSQRIIGLIAGDYSTHSEAIADVIRQAKRNPAAEPHEVALMYGAAIQAIRRRHAEDQILAPLGLNTDTFLAQQKEMSNDFVAAITSQMQTFDGPDVEALVLGMDGDLAHLYAVDSRGTVRSHDDIGFAAIGIGAWHAKSQLMQAGYVNSWGFAPVLAVTYAAKKAAEVAPGVGKATDTHLVGRDGIVPLWPKTADKLKEVFQYFDAERIKLGVAAIQALQDFINDPQTYQIETSVVETTKAIEARANDGGSDSATPRSSAEAGIKHATEGSDQLQGKEPQT